MNFCVILAQWPSYSSLYQSNFSTRADYDEAHRRAGVWEGRWTIQVAGCSSRSLVLEPRWKLIVLPSTNQVKKLLETMSAQSCTLIETCFFNVPELRFCLKKQKTNKTKNHTGIQTSLQELNFPRWNACGWRWRLYFSMLPQGGSRALLKSDF